MEEGAGVWAPAPYVTGENDLEWGKRSTAEELTRVAMTLEGNSNSLLLCGGVRSITSRMNNVKIF